ncbi:hypothetical protein FQR65_LT20622 [Abscondita terminalis]|nr:hypothetical protein FQR65_LT20622 [Abscondita terminalis]
MKFPGVAARARPCEASASAPAIARVLSDKKVRNGFEPAQVTERDPPSGDTKANCSCAYAGQAALGGGRIKSPGAVPASWGEILAERYGEDAVLISRRRHCRLTTLDGLTDSLFRLPQPSYNGRRDPIVRFAERRLTRECTWRALRLVVEARQNARVSPRIVDAELSAGPTRYCGIRLSMSRSGAGRGRWSVLLASLHDA